MTQQVENPDEEAIEVKEKYAEDVYLYGKWKYNGIQKVDESLKDQICLDPKWYPHTAGRWQKKNDFVKFNVQLLNV